MRKLRTVGGLGLIASFELRDTLAEYYTGPGADLFLWSVQPRYRSVIRSMVQSDVLDYMIEKCVRIGFTYHEFFPCSDPGLPVSEALENMRTDPGVLRDLRAWRSDLNISTDMAGLLMSEATAISDMIKQELSSFQTEGENK